jgi:hypothetical protein
VRKPAIIGAVLLAAASSSAGAAGDLQDPDWLRGQIFIAGATLVDPPVDELRRSHAYFEVVGDAARHLFDAMPVRAVPDLCVPGRQFKQAGHMTCSVGARAPDARCDFAIDLRSGELAVGSVC